MLIVRLCSALGVLAASLVVAASPATQLVKPPLPATSVTVVAEDFLQLTTSAGSPPLARINVMRESPIAATSCSSTTRAGPST